MTYLSSEDRIKLNILEGYPRRALTPIELVIRHIQTFDYQYTYSDHVKTLRWGDKKKEELMTEVAVTLGHNPDLAALARRALVNEQARTELFNKYPYVKHFDLLNAAKHKGLLGCHLAGFGEYEVRRANDFLKSFWHILTSLPKNTGNVFVSTPGMPYPNVLRNVAINSKDKALFGITLPKDTQAKINEMFGKNVDQLITMIENFGLHQQPELIKYFHDQPSTETEGVRLFSLFQTEDCPYSRGKYLQVIMLDHQYSFYIDRGFGEILGVKKAA